VACGALTDRLHALCGSCWRALTFLAPPWCDCCGKPFDTAPFPAGGNSKALCGACLARPPAYDSARAALAYDEASRSLILAFKHGDRTDAGPALARLMGRVCEFPVDLAVPVPLTRWRLWRRRYNQAALLAATLARDLSVEVVPGALVRRPGTPRQAGLDAAARRRNVAGSIAVDPAVKPRINGARVMLVDDVYTTGATVDVAAKALRKTGAQAVHVVTLARVDRPARIDG
jgi:ComF family protein